MNNLIPRQTSARRFAKREFAQVTLGRTVVNTSVAGLRVMHTLHPAGMRLPCHDHEDANINIVISGATVESIAGRTFECLPGAVLVKPAGAQHANIYGTLDVHCVLIQFPQAVPAFDRFGDLLLEPRLLRSGMGKRLLTEVAAADLAPTDDAQLRVFEAIIELLTPAASRPPLGSTSVVPHWLARTYERLNAMSDEKILIGDLAADADVDAVTLCRKFTAAFGCTPSDYLRQCRVARAAEAIARQGSRLSEIACESGFADQAHLTRVFRKLVGMTPGEYRSFISNN